MSDYFECETPDTSNFLVQTIALDLDILRVHDDSGAFQDIRLVISEKTCNGVQATISETWVFQSKKELLQTYPTFESILDELKNCDAWRPNVQPFMYYFRSISGSSGVYVMPDYTPSCEVSSTKVVNNVIPSNKRSPKR